MFPVPFNDTQRLEALESYDVLDTGPNEALDCLTRVASAHFKCPVALVSLVDETRQWFKSGHGLEAVETDRESAFCGHTIQTNEPLVILDATRDARFSDNTLVCGSPEIRFYAGAPLITPLGFRLGTFCVIDVEAREDFSSADTATLKDFAKTAMEMLELQRRVKSHEAQPPENDCAEKARVDLFSTVAHEIRSPVAALCSSAKILESQIFGPPGDERYLEFFCMMSETAEQVVNLADRMLNFARLRTGDVEMKEELVGVRDLLGKAKRLAVMESGADGACVRIADMEHEIFVRADKVYLAQMLQNLILNALKYNDGNPEILLNAGLSDAGVLTIDVIDSGIGMNEEGIRLALQPYAQIQQTGRKFVGGVGIGLPLVKRLIEMHGGRLAIESKENIGTKASLLLPAYRVESIRDLAVPLL
ncbi:GAF domain-containing sensor histidine kinase [Denitrobaculum tricleocarpae]|uniref:histidine kinase n=1 Tax=Denitrobaculum tricleocarpae TaxID=2591009 RepID=A0A545TQ25_9PROT|nr:GAF domain-containing sensor histidine kinase [Denitrobaculum tricleocarpae]TQV79327.1 GAF domain-containing sensor histidine kinase [Denitrobaculum tricleocarpae]